MQAICIGATDNEYLLNKDLSHILSLIDENMNDVDIKYKIVVDHKGVVHHSALIIVKRKEIDIVVSKEGA